MDQQLLNICDAVIGQKHQIEPTKHLANSLRQFLVRQDDLIKLLEDCEDAIDDADLLQQITSMREALERIG